MNERQSPMYRHRIMRIIAPRNEGRRVRTPPIGGKSSSIEGEGRTRGVGLHARLVHGVGLFIRRRRCSRPSSLLEPSGGFSIGLVNGIAYKQQ